MDSLPPEMLAQIIGIVRTDGNLARYSTISRAWKASIERLTFQRITITTDELDEFAVLFEGDNISRQACLAHLFVDFILPLPPNADGCCAVVSPPDREADSTAFSTSVFQLFTILAGIASRAIEKRPFSLCFQKGYRRLKPGGLQYSWSSCWSKLGISRGEHSERKLEKAEARSGKFELLHPDNLPTLPGVTTFDYSELVDLQNLKFTCIPHIIARLPDINILRLRTTDQYRYGRLKRIEHKECFVASICNVPGDFIREIRIRSDQLTIQNENAPVHHLVDSGDYVQEPWSRMLNHFASFPNLTILQLYGSLGVCPEFFRAIINHPGTPFPSLLEFELQFAPETADGRWFYERDEERLLRSRADPEYAWLWKREAKRINQQARRTNQRWSRYSDSDDSEGDQRIDADDPFDPRNGKKDQFRSLPSQATFMPFLLDASKAVQRLPSLRKFILKLDNLHAGPRDLTLWPVVSRVFELWYLKAGMHRSPPRFLLDLSLLELNSGDPYVPGDAAYLNRNRLYWRVDNAEIWEEVKAAWSATAGPDPKTVFIKENRWMKHNDPKALPIGYHYGYEGEF